MQTSSGRPRNMTKDDPKWYLSYISIHHYQMCYLCSIFRQYFKGNKSKSIFMILLLAPKYSTNSLSIKIFHHLKKKKLSLYLTECTWLIHIVIDINIIGLHYNKAFTHQPRWSAKKECKDKE